MSALSTKIKSKAFFPHKVLHRKKIDTFRKQYKDILAQEILKETRVTVKILRKYFPKIRAPYQKLPLENDQIKLDRKIEYVILKSNRKHNMQSLEHSTYCFDSW